MHPPPDAGGEGVVAFGLVSSAASSNLPLPAKQIHASRLHRSKRRNACGAFVGHAPPAAKLKTEVAQLGVGNFYCLERYLGTKLGTYPLSQSAKSQSGRQDSNLRPSAPKAPALPSCATPRTQTL